MSSPTDLYRFYSAENELLYVGVSWNVESRWHDHLCKKEWWPDVERATIEHFSTRHAAECAEKQAIRREFPIWNIAHNDEGDQEYIDILVGSGFAVHG